MFNLVVACDSARGFGKDGNMPWPKNLEDMKHFFQITTSGEKNALIMGRKTWDSLPDSLRNDPNRKKYIVSRSLPPGFLPYENHKSGNECFAKTYYNTQVVNKFNYRNFPTEDSKKYWIIGGAKFIESLFQEDATFISKIYLTEFSGQYPADTYLGKFPPYFVETERARFSSGHFVTYENRLDPTSQENQYLSLLQKILEQGETRPDRTGIGTVSLFGHQLRFDLQKRFPLLTTKRVFFRGVVEELLFFLRGDHDNRKLIEKGVHIWSKNTSKEYIEKYGKKLEEHDLGKAYPVQWRASGAPLQKLDDSYIGKGIDQLSYVIDLLKNDPYSRRIILNAWNVSDLEDMILVPCHMLYQFYVTNDNGEQRLSCMMVQRSADTFLGLPFNIASVAILTHILANICNMKVKEIIINIGDAHIYNNHLEQVRAQLQRPTIFFPTLSIDKDLETIKDIEDLQFTDFTLSDYHCWPTIKADMAV